jgi:hypothetical protein
MAVQLVWLAGDAVLRAPVGTAAYGAGAHRAVVLAWFSGELLLRDVRVAMLAMFGAVRTIEELMIVSFELRLLYHACWAELKLQMRL